MATRFYFRSSGAVSVAPTFDSSWGVTTGAGTLPAAKTKGNTTLANLRLNVAGSTKKLFEQFVSGPIAPINFNGYTFSLVLYAFLDSGLGNGSLAVSVRLYHQDTTFTTLISLGSFDSLFVAQPQSRIINSATLPNVSSLNNDRIVVEIGVSNTAVKAETCGELFGDPTANADAPLSSGDTNYTTRDPWFEFSGSVPNAFVATPELDSTLSFSGALFTKPSHLYFAAALNFAGLIAGRSARLGLSPAVLSFAGNTTKRLRRTLLASITSAGAQNRMMSVRKTATLSFSGAVKGVRNVLIQATLSFAGSLKRAISSTLASLLSFAPDIKLGKPGGGIFYVATFTGRLGTTASSSKLIQSNQSSNLALSSSGSNTISIKQNATLTLSAGITNFINLGRAGMNSVLHLSGTMNILKGKVFTATLSFLPPTLRRRIFSIQPSTLSFSAQLPKFIVTGIFNAVLSFIGLRVDQMQLLVQGATVMRITSTGGTVMRITAKYDPNFNAADIP